MAFMTEIGAPLASSALFSAASSSSVRLPGGAGRRADPAAADQGDDEIIRGKPLYGIKKRLRGSKTRRIGYGMRRLEHADPPAGRGIAVARDDNALQRAIPKALESRGKLCGTFPGAR
jgi:hypothetical protein